MKTAIITGVTGQDGIYLSELLVLKGYHVVGCVTDVARGAAKIPDHLKNDLELVEWDMCDQSILRDILVQYNPIEIYNLAAYTSGAGMFDDAVNVGNINGLAVTRILESIRKINSKIRLCQASSREIFGDAVESPQSEKTTPIPRSPYGAAKLYADSMVKIYRQHHSIYACSAILYNHESPRRGKGFVTRKITLEAAKIKLNLSDVLYLGNLETQRDWGFAGDYVYAMWQILQQNSPDDYILATGETHSVRELCKCAFDYLGLDYRNYVKENIDNYRPSESLLLVGDARKAMGRLHWKPQISFQDLVVMMVESDLQYLLSQNLK